ncbi:MAG: hypothetical protein MZU97_09860 [Bacillus subtilis]|nr:hypothetical protein [Bacillus subtilis]
MFLDTTGQFDYRILAGYPSGASRLWVSDERSRSYPCIPAQIDMLYDGTGTSLLHVCNTRRLHPSRRNSGD